MYHQQEDTATEAVLCLDTKAPCQNGLPVNKFTGSLASGDAILGAERGVLCHVSNPSRWRKLSLSDCLETTEWIFHLKGQKFISDTGPTELYPPAINNPNDHHSARESAKGVKHWRCEAPMLTCPTGVLQRLKPQVRLCQNPRESSKFASMDLPVRPLRGVSGGGNFRFTASPELNCHFRGQQLRWDINHVFSPSYPSYPLKQLWLYPYMGVAQN